MGEITKILNSIILKHRTNLVESTPDYNSASEIASLVRGFEEWKDNMLFEDILSYWQSSNLYNLWKEDRDNTGDINYVFIGEYTLDELFSYWYQNVKSKNN